LKYQNPLRNTGLYGGFGGKSGYMAENKHVMTAESFVEQICAKISEFEASLTTAFQRTIQEINLDREHIATDRAEILSLTKRVEALERLVAGLPPKLDS
jgi:polyhydroxyalkanoate synthesis regulator phasin